MELLLLISVSALGLLVTVWSTRRRRAGRVKLEGQHELGRWEGEGGAVLAVERRVPRRPRSS